MKLPSPPKPRTLKGSTTDSRPSLKLKIETVPDDLCGALEGRKTKQLFLAAHSREVRLSNHSSTGL